MKHAPSRNVTDKLVEGIKFAGRLQYSAEDYIGIVPAGLLGRDDIAAL